ncbi:cell division protein ZapE [Rhodobacteraceae bacterium 2376]|uniref:Cell division protein ZapE n=1 Tax=Rhabdonatronobacter sediminivivens TaxID=2743469 RepID=A0A7Z0KXF8_9RHOB|nr:cell division protein ZapE [Rhabdonatronobacter sediminivivens]NYS24832.1 cell division protein ZapE [Rhabdonatronobacter sediminivivens]
MDLIAAYDARIEAGTLRPDAAQRGALPLFVPLMEHLRQPPPKPAGRLRSLFARPPDPPPGLYLWGGVGRGKSMLMDLFHEHAPTPAKRRVHFHAFMQEVHAGMHAARQKGTEDALAPVAAAVVRDLRLLCFDEMQITDITDAMIVGRLFQKLMAGGVVIVTTSNRPPEDLYKDGLNRALFLPFIALLNERMVVHQLQSETDYRQQRLQGEQVYFTPANAESDAAMTRMWDDLTGHDPGTPLELVVKGRKLVLPRHHNGVARASFWDLCGQPLGPADYLALAQAVRVLMISRIPLLSASNYNQAKRFVTLIDALYEAQVRVIASAADEPERLYVEGEGTFEFERTASRLREMQAADWGQA